MSASTPIAAKNAWQWLERKIVYSMGFGVVVLLAVGGGLFYYWETKPPEAPVVRIAYGAGAPVRKRFLELVARQGRQHNLDIRLIATQGTDDTLSKIDEEQADLGLIAGVVQDRGSRRVLEVTPLYMEPLQLLVKAELYEAVFKDFGELRGKVIDVDGERSATNLLATELLRFMGLNDPVSGKPLYQPVFIPQLDLLEGKIPGRLPDAIFQIGGVPSGSIRRQIVDNNYRLVPLPFGASFNLDKFRDAELPDSAASARIRLNKSFVEEAVIPEFAYSVLPAVPPTDTRTIATRLVLVGNDSLKPHVVHQVLNVIFSPEVAGFATPELAATLLDDNFQFDRHPGTVEYVNSLKPVDVESAFVNYGRLAEVWGIIITLYIAAAKGLKTWRNRKRFEKKSVGDFMQDVMEIEAEAGASCTGEGRVALDQRLSEIKAKAVELHLEEMLDDAEELPSLLVTLADTRTRIWGPVS